MGYCPQAGLGTGRTGVGAGALGWALGAAGSWARGRKAQRTCAGVCGRERACADGRGRAHDVHAQAGKQADVRGARRARGRQ